MKAARRRAIPQLQEDPLWFKDAVIYELHVRAFCDSNGDGGGDFRGLASKMEYLRELGATDVWLLPFYPSPLKDDGYDIADYTGVHPAYGTLADVRLFLREAHRHGIRVITELVLNHTSDQHPWFQRARRAPAGSRFRNFYVWSDTPDRYRDTRIIFKDFESSNWTWDPVAKAYYWHRFYSHQPDLNYDNPEVRAEILKAMDFWLEMGVDGLRLDAVPYLFEREGTTCENLPETHAALRDLRKHVDERFGHRMLLAEANQWPEDAVAYFGAGDECQMAFHFPLMPRMFMAVRMEDRYPVIDILDQTPNIPETCQWALFLRNHDELTLEMVTDEERDYMYRVYAHDPQARINLGIRRRLAPLLGNDRRRIELMNGLLFSLPGTPVLYYGDEIGMGDNIYLGDRNGVRTPMQWSSDRNAGFSRANPQRLYLPPIIDPGFSYEAINVQAQLDNVHSLLWWMRRLIALRKRMKAFGRGSLEFLYPSNRKVLAYVRRYQDETLLVVANLSRYSQYVELDLSAHRQAVPVELFGNSEFPPVGELPYMLTLGPHAFYWFALTAARQPAVTPKEVEELPGLRVADAWHGLFRGRGRLGLEAALPRILRRRRWFSGKGRQVKGTELLDAVPFGAGAAAAVIAFARVDYTEGDPETYVLPLGFAKGERARTLTESEPASILANLEAGGEKGVLYGALSDPSFADSLLEAVARRRRFKGTAGELSASPTTAFRRVRGSEPLKAGLLKAEQSNSSVLFGDRLILKLFRRVEDGVNPEVEIGAYLTEVARYPHVPPCVGQIEYRPRTGGVMTVGVVQGFVANEGDAWQFTLDSLGRYFDRFMARSSEEREATVPTATLLDLTQSDIPPLAHELIGTYLEAARLLGQRTAELHLALASHPEDPAFAPEGFTPFYQRSLYQSMRNLTDQVFQLLRRRVSGLPEDTRGLAQKVVEQHQPILRRFRSLLDRRITALRTRHHGDYHLGQVLWTGRDFVLIDFEGEPARPLSTRRIKRSPLRDVAGMIRSFHYASHQGLENHRVKHGLSPQAMKAVGPWADLWYLWVSSAFLRAYLKTAGAAAFVPQDRKELLALLVVYLLEKAVYELGYELNNRPDWVSLPLQGILRLLDAEA